MPQNPIPVTPFRPGGLLAAFDVAAAAVIKASPGTVYRIAVNVAPSAGDLVINDNTATGGSNTITNQIVSIPFGSLTLGTVVTLEWPCANGIVISSVGTGGVYSVSYS